MATNRRCHAFAGNPLLRSDDLKGVAFSFDAPSRVLPFRKGRVLACSEEGPSSWRLCWLSPSDLEGHLSGAPLVFLGREEGGVGCWAVDLPSVGPAGLDVGEGRGRAFVDLRTLMVASDWSDVGVMGELAVAGNAKALIEWHATSRFCGYCGAPTKPIDAGRRKQCIEESCKKRMYPRIDPVVIMLVIDKANDRALLSRQSRFVPRMWSCLAGFIEPGESLEEAVRRETLEETGIEVGEVIYHSSQPWPVGPSSMPCQLMVGFFAYAKSHEIKVDRKELEDARWHCKEDVKKVLAFAEYEKAQRSSAMKVKDMCNGIQREQSFLADVNVESAELVPTFFVPGPYAIAHHLISCWAHNKMSPNDPDAPSSLAASFSNL